MLTGYPPGPYWLDERCDGLITAWTGSRAICCTEVDTGNTDPPAIVAHTTRGWSEDGGLALARLLAGAPEMYEALVRIAAYDDIDANARLVRDGSYASFDEPGAVQTAREVLAQIEGRADG